MRLFYFLSLFLIVLTLTAQNLVTAGQFFKKVSNTYSSFQTYKAQLSITQNGTINESTVYYKKPNLFRIDYNNGQSMVSNGKEVLIYIPRYSVVFKQDLNKTANSNIATPEGLSLLSNSYGISYLIDVKPVPLEGTEINVVKLRLTRKIDTLFSQMILSIDENNFIRRIEALSLDGQKFIFNYNSVQINVELDPKIFEYDIPAGTIISNNFLGS